MASFFPNTLIGMDVKEMGKGEDRGGEAGREEVEREGRVGGKGPIISCGGPPELKTAICSQIDLSTPA